jgi:hypothetical protein
MKEELVNVRNIVHDQLWTHMIVKANHHVYEQVGCDMKRQVYGQLRNLNDQVYWQVYNQIASRK